MVTNLWSSCLLHASWQNQIQNNLIFSVLTLLFALLCTTGCSPDHAVIPCYWDYVKKMKSLGLVTQKC